MIFGNYFPCDICPLIETEFCIDCDPCEKILDIDPLGDYNEDVQNNDDDYTK